MADAPEKPLVVKGRKKRSSGSTALVFLSFGLIIFLILPVGQAFRLWVGAKVGFVMTPVIGFRGAYPIFTILVASLILVAATTAVRHFLIDWVNMARTQEAMRNFQKEFNQARKDNNTYKIKKLTDAQPEIMEMQAEMSTENMKPMAFTMLIVVPIFAWLYLFMVAAAPHGAASHIAIEPPTGQSAVLLDVTQGTLQNASTGADMVATTQFQAYALSLDGGTGSVHLRNDRADYATDVPLIPVAQADAAAVTVPTGKSYNFAVAGIDDAHNLSLGDHKTDRVLLVVQDGGSASAWALGPGGTDLTVSPTARVLALVPVEGDAGSAAKGAQQVVVRDGGKDGTEVARINVGPANVVALTPENGRTMAATAIKMPWDKHWDLNSNANPPEHHFYLLGFLPRWIVLYSLFGIPLGQIAQRALKLWEYRHHKLGKGELVFQENA